MAFSLFFTTFAPKIRKQMTKIACMMVSAAMLLLAACTSQPIPETPVGVEQGRSINALVCEGSNDTLLIYLTTPYDGSDPDTLNVLWAWKNHRIYGIPNVGDNVVVLRNDSDSTCADVVIVTEDLMGRWGFETFPSLRQMAGMPADTSLLPDTLKQLLKVSREYSINFKNDHTMLSLGGRRRSKTEEMPIEYPQMKQYTEWGLDEDRLLLYVSAVDSTGEINVTGVDTASFVMLRRDTMVLRINGEERGFSKK